LLAFSLTSTRSSLRSLATISMTLAASSGREWKAERLVNTSTCRNSRPAVLALQEELEETAARAVRAAGSTARGTRCEARQARATLQSLARSGSSSELSLMASISRRE